MSKLPFHVVHYSDKDPREHVGGVETFARGLLDLFGDVTFMTPDNLDVDLVVESRLPVICDYQRVIDWPDEVPVIGFQHGVGAVKFRVTKSYHHWVLARAQRKAARRPNTLWVACAEWISESHGRLYGNQAAHVVYHPIDITRFDGSLDNRDSRLVLHDARTPHKGSKQIEKLSSALPEWRFEGLDCPPELVPDRMRKAAAFVHLSKYEGNSIVCNEAMAMDLPCLFTRVGLMQDDHGPDDVAIVDPGSVFGREGDLVSVVTEFLDSLDSRAFHPRRWILEHATPQRAITGWERVIDTFHRDFEWPRRAVRR